METMSLRAAELLPLSRSCTNTHKQAAAASARQSRQMLPLPRPPFPRLLRAVSRESVVDDDDEALSLFSLPSHPSSIEHRPASLCVSLVVAAPLLVLLHVG